jgi:hypothetical protein
MAHVIRDRQRSALPVAALLALACAHATSPEGGIGDASNGPSSEPQAAPGGSGEPGDAILTVVWTDPSPRFAVACGADLFDQRQHWLRAAAGGPVTERFLVRAGTGKVQLFVADATRFQSAWGIFEDGYTCAGRGTLRVDLHVEGLPDGRLAVDTTYTAQGCRIAAGPIRRFVSRQSDPPRRICCGEHRDEFRAE